MFDFLFGWRKASKCKKLLRQVQCRLVLLKNKRCSIVRQLRQDVAELLKLGHAHIALTRAEQIYKDERIIEVYNMLDHFCEFIVINIGYIRRHKDCPNDINEAISSLIFASARCGDIPELRRVRKLFAERYGQRFVMSAIELLPGNLINCQVRNNLSIRTVSDDVTIKLVNDIIRECNFLCGSSELPLAVEYKSDWHQQQMKGNKVDETPDDLVDDELLCLTFPGSSPAEQLPSAIKALVPVNHGLQKQENSAENVIVQATLSHTSDELVQCLEENVGYLDDIQEFKSLKSKDISLVDKRVFLFKSSVLQSKQIFKDEDDLPAAKSFKKTGKVCHRKSKKRWLSREYWTFKDLSYENYYGSNKRKQPKNNKDFSRCKVCKCSCHSTNCPKQGMMLPVAKSCHSGKEVISVNGREDSLETDFYSCSDCSSNRSVSMPYEPQDMEQGAQFAQYSSFPSNLSMNGNQIHPKLPDYKELETTFLALKNIYLQNKNN